MQLDNKDFYSLPVKLNIPPPSHQRCFALLSWWASHLAFGQPYKHWGKEEPN